MKRPGYFRGLAILAFALLFVGAVLSVDWPSPAGFDEQNDTVRNEDVGRAMFGVSGASGYGLIMVFIGVLLLVALLGGIFLAKEEKEEDQ
jgi:NADH:ubiquinone oxidoreductase subunit 6 (subunit J)